tara:strand:+ start:398 stop:643 length:246 start_codon:yes stop_codon:yes gene_type:complete
MTNEINTETTKKLENIINNILMLEDRKKEISESIKETYEGANSAGFDPKIIRLVIKRKKEDSEKLKQDELVLETYEKALGN